MRSHKCTGGLHALNVEFATRDEWECLVLFLDDILVYSKSVEKHKEHLRRIFETLWKNGLYAKKSKCEFGVSDIEFLGHLCALMESQ